MGRVVIVALKNITLRGYEHVVRITHIFAGWSQSCSVGVDSHGHSPDIDLAIGAGLPNRVRISVVAAGQVMSPVFGSDISTAISKGKMPLSAGSAHHPMNRMIVILVLKAGQEDLSLIDL